MQTQTKNQKGGASQKSRVTIRTMSLLRELPVRELTAIECRQLTVHHHGRALDPMRRKAYLLKGHPGSEMAFFKAGEIKVIERAIEEGI